jgi:hypothetical protein
MRGASTCASVIAAIALALLSAAPASALPTMIRLRYIDCASCHIAPQGGGPLTAYGRGIDIAQSLRVSEDRTIDDNRRVTQDLRFVVQEQGTWASGTGGVNFFRPRLLYRNATAISNALRVSAMVTAESAHAPRPALGYDPAARSSTIFVNTALIHYKPSAALELAFGRDQLPSGVNVPDLAFYVKSRNRLGYYDAPTQLKMFWGARRYHITPFVYAPGGNEPAGERESGAGSLAEVDVLGHQRTIAGVTFQRGTARNGGRRMVGAYARLGFGQWGILAEHDVTDRTRNDLGGVAFRQTASYAHVFWAVREWLVASGIGERLRVEAPFAESLNAGKVELAARLSNHATVVAGTRFERNVLTQRWARSVIVQMAFKTVQ